MILLMLLISLVIWFLCYAFTAVLVERQYDREGAVMTNMTHVYLFIGWVVALAYYIDIAIHNPINGRMSGPRKKQDEEAEQ